MPVGEALMVALSGFIVVFIMLCVLWAIINLVNVVTTSIEKKEAAPVNKAEPVGVTGVIRVAADRAPEVYTPFCREKSAVRPEEGGFVVTLPEKCSYAILRFTGK